MEKAESVWVIVVRHPVSSTAGGLPLLLKAMEGAVYMRAALFSYVWRCGEQCHGADGRPGESCSSRGVVARPVLVQERLRGWRRSGWSSDRHRGPDRGCRQRGARTRHSGDRGDVLSPRTPTASGMSSQCPVWRCSGGDGHTGLTATGKTAPAGLTSQRSPV
jgi:hypothetical protein